MKGVRLIIASILFVVILAPYCNGANNVLALRCVEVDKNNQCTMYGPSIIELIAYPDRYDGKKVRVIGFLHLEFEGDAIYLSQDDHKYGITKNGLWVSFGSEIRRFISRLLNSDGYVLVEGIFNARNRGHGSLFSGTIENITRADKWRSVNRK